MSTENELFQEWRDARGTPKEKQAEDSLVKKLRSYAMKICWVVLKRPCPDIVNTACYQAIEHSGDFRGDSKFTTWFYTVVYNLCQSEVRKSKQRKEIGFQDLTHAQYQELATEPQEDRKIGFKQAIGRLTETEQKFVEYKMSCATDEFIAAQLGISEGAVRVRWSRLKKKIVGELTK